MSQPVKLSDALVLDARQTGTIAERSIAGQMEFWARLGRTVEPLLSGDRALALRRTGDQQPFSQLIGSVDAVEGQRRLSDVLAARPFPHYEPAADRPGLVARIEENGARSIGRFVQGTFEIVKATSAKNKSPRPKPNGRSGL